jgi:glycosyltransferase involved in cell wall biosynthesis
MKPHKITVFTPTYNRAYILDRVYKSLINQTNKSFVWLIVDDGSTDNTESLVKKWIKEDKIEIKYYKQKNGGKQRAHNKAVKLTDTDLFICLDSDDYFTKDAIEILLNSWNKIKDKNNIAGIIALKGVDKKNHIGTNMPQNVTFSTLRDLYNKYGFTGDTALLYKTDILKKFPFYVAENEKFMGESYVYDQIDQNCEMYLLDKIIYVCEYLEDGYTANVKKLIRNNPKGYMILNKQKITFSNNVKRRFINTVKYLVGGILNKEKNLIKNSPDKILAILAFLPAYLYFLIYYKGQRK